MTKVVSCWIFHRYPICPGVNRIKILKQGWTVEGTFPRLKPVAGLSFVQIHPFRPKKNHKLSCNSPFKYLFIFFSLFLVLQVNGFNSQDPPFKILTFPCKFRGLFKVTVAQDPLGVLAQKYRSGPNSMFFKQFMPGHIGYLWSIQLFLPIWSSSLRDTINSSERIYNCIGDNSTNLAGFPICKLSLIHSHTPLPFLKE